jgi:hypothetical protein
MPFIRVRVRVSQDLQASVIPIEQRIAFLNRSRDSTRSKYKQVPEKKGDLTIYHHKPAWIFPSKPD